MGVTADGKRFVSVPHPKINTRFLADTDDKLMNRMILDGFAVVLEGDPILSTDDSYCGCNCDCCFNDQSNGLTTD